MPAHCEFFPSILCCWRPDIKTCGPTALLRAWVLSVHSVQRGEILLIITHKYAVSRNVYKTGSASLSLDVRTVVS